MRTIDIKLPESWTEIPDQQVIKLAGILRDPGTRSSFYIKAFLIVTGIQPVKKKSVFIDHARHFWFRQGKMEFLLSNRQLADASDKLSFMLDDSRIPVPVWKGSRFWFTPPVFGLYNLTVEQYLNCENNFAAFSANGDEKHLVKLALNLWAPKWFTQKTEKRINLLDPDVKNAINLFYIGSRDYLSEKFPTLFRKAPEGSSGSGDITQLIRTLNGGDVTRNESILKVQLWDALKQLEDMALQAERIKKSYKK